MKKMISICDTEVQSGRLVVADQRDFNVPNFCLADIERLCHCSRVYRKCCVGDCESCVITRLIEEIKANMVRPYGGV